MNHAHRRHTTHTHTHTVCLFSSISVCYTHICLDAPSRFPAVAGLRYKMPVESSIICARALFNWKLRHNSRIGKVHCGWCVPPSAQRIIAALNRGAVLLCASPSRWHDAKSFGGRGTSFRSPWCLRFRCAWRGGWESWAIKYWLCRVAWMMRRGANWSSNSSSSTERKPAREMAENPTDGWLRGWCAAWVSMALHLLWVALEWVVCVCVCVVEWRCHECAHKRT